MVNLKMFTAGEYYGLPKSIIIAHNLDGEMCFQVKEKNFFFGSPVLKIIMFLSSENCGLPRPHGLPYTLVYNFSNSKTCCNKFVILLQLYHRIFTFIYAGENLWLTLFLVGEKHGFLKQSERK